MPFLHNVVTGWTDLDDHSRFRNRIPTTMILADEIANGEWDGLLGDDFKGEVNRRVVYVDEAGNREYMELTLYIHPSGAGALTIRTGSTPDCRGSFITEVGALSATKPLVNSDIAGGMLSQYSETSSEIGSSTAREPVWSTTLQEGDAIWVVRRGRYLALCDGAAVVNIGTNVVLDDSGGTAGAIEDAVTPNAANPTWPQIIQNSNNQLGGCIGAAIETEDDSVVGFAYIDLELPRRYAAP